MTPRSARVLSISVAVSFTPSDFFATESFERLTGALMFVHPEQIAAVVKPHPEFDRVCRFVGRNGKQDTIMLKADCASIDAAVFAKIGDTQQAVSKFQGTIELVPSGPSRTMARSSPTGGPTGE